MRTKTIGLAAAALTIASGATACGSSGATAPASHSASAATPATAS